MWKPPDGVAVTTIADLPEWQPQAQAADFMATFARRGKPSPAGL